MEALLKKQLAIKESLLKSYEKMEKSGVLKNSDKEIAKNKNSIIGEIQCLRNLLTNQTK